MTLKDNSLKTSRFAASKPAIFKPHTDALEVKIAFGRLAQWSIPLPRRAGRVPGRGNSSPLEWAAPPPELRIVPEEAGCERAMPREGAKVSFHLIPRPRVPGGNWYVDIEFTCE